MPTRLLSLGVILRLLSFSPATNAQVKIVNAFLRNPDSCILYIGISNPAILENITTENYTVYGRNGTVSKTLKGFYCINPTNPGVDTLRLVQNGRIIAEKSFHLRYLPPPAARMSGITTHAATKEAIVGSKTLTVVLGELAQAANYSITSFQLIAQNIEHPDEKELIKNKSNILSEQSMALIQRLRCADTITFNHIEARDPNNQILPLPPFTITIR